MKFPNIVKRYQKQLTALLVLLVFAVYYLRNRSDFAVLAHVNPWYVAFVALGYIAIVVTNGLFIRYVVRPFGVTLGLYESTRVSLFSSLGNFFASSGAGLGYRAVYLKKNHGLGYRDYMTTLYGNYLIIFIVNCVAGLVALTISGRSATTVGWIAGGVLSIILAMSILLTFRQTTVKDRPGFAGKVIKNLRMMSAGWQAVAKDRGLFAGLTVLVIVQLGITTGILHFEFLALGLSVSFAGLLFLSVLSALSVFINITPANLGVKEGAYILSTSIVGLSSSQILAVAVVDRGALFATLGVLWLLLAKNVRPNTKHQNTMEVR